MTSWVVLRWRPRTATLTLRSECRTTTTARPRAPGAAAVAVSFSEILKPSATAALADPRTAATTSGATPRTRLVGRERSAIFMGNPPLAGWRNGLSSHRVCACKLARQRHDMVFRMVGAWYPGKETPTAGDAAA